MGQAKNMKRLLPLLFLCFMLTACSEPKVGGIFILKRTAMGGMHIDSMESTFSQMKVLEELGDPDSAEEYLDYEAITTFSVGTLIKVTEVNEGRRMVRIQDIDPKTKSKMKMWMGKEDLERALE